jgi:hypothetical protein
VPLLQGLRLVKHLLLPSLPPLLLQLLLQRL